MYYHKSLNIVFLVPYPHGIAPGQRFRFEQYINLLGAEKHQIFILSFLSEGAYSVLYKKGHTVSKVYSIVLGIVKRFWHLSKVFSADYVFVFRECSPIGPPILEWIVAKMLRKKIIYDFDDAIWLTDKLSESKIEKLIRWRSKVSSICKWSYKISCGNAYLADYAKQFNSNVIINPTTIDTEQVHNPYRLMKITPSRQKELISKDNSSVVIGWTGSHSTLKYLKSLETVLGKIEAKFEQVSFMVIADRKPEMRLRRLNFIPWNKETEVEDLFRLDIGIMPLPDDEWAKGKCGFKALQYMALGIPAVISPVGVNNTIIQHGVNGFLADTEQEWFEALSQLIEKKELRKNIGIKAIETVEKNYSVNSNKKRFLNLFI
jgi:glycosyltransferase involved in cell wall biosynthesis